MSLISICIPAYNRAALLDSVLSQDFNDFDIVIAEDFSPERQGIAAKVAEYQQRFGNKVRYHENPQTLGYDGNLRRLVGLATGDYVLFMSFEYIEVLYNRKRQHSSLGYKSPIRFLDVWLIAQQKEKLVA